MFNKLQTKTKPAKYLAQASVNKSGMLVLIKFMYQINRRNMVVGTPEDIAIRSGITMRDFSLGVRALKKYDCIRKYSKREYMVNPELIYNGDDKQFYIVKHMWDNQTSRGLRG